MHRLAMTSGGLAKFFFLVTLARCCCGSAFFGPAAPQHKFAQEDWPEVAVAAARANARVGTAMLHYPAELRQRRPAAQQLFFSTLKNLAMPSLLADNFLSPSTTSCTRRISCYGSAAPERVATSNKPVPDPTDPSHPRKPRTIPHQTRPTHRPYRPAETIIAMAAPTGAAFLYAVEKDTVENIAIKFDKSTCSDRTAWHADASEAVMIVVVQARPRPRPPQKDHTSLLSARHPAKSNPSSSQAINLPNETSSTHHLPQELLDRNGDGALAGLEMNDLFPLITSTYYNGAEAWCFQTGAALANLIKAINAPLLTTGANGVQYTLTVADWVHKEVHQAKKQDTVLTFKMRSAGTGKDKAQSLHVNVQNAFREVGLNITSFNQGTNVLNSPLKLFYGEFEMSKALVVSRKRAPDPALAPSPPPYPTHNCVPSPTSPSHQCPAPFPLPTHSDRQRPLPVDGPRRHPHHHRRLGRRVDHRLQRGARGERRHRDRRPPLPQVLPHDLRVRTARPDLELAGQAQVKGTGGSDGSSHQEAGAPAPQRPAPLRVDPPPRYPRCPTEPGVSKHHPS